MRIVRLAYPQCTAFLAPTKARGGCNREGGEEIEGPIKGAVMGGSNYALMQVGRAPEYVHCFFSPHREASYVSPRRQGLRGTQDTLRQTYSFVLRIALLF